MDSGGRFDECGGGFGVGLRIYVMILVLSNMCIWLVVGVMDMWWGFNMLVFE